MAKGPHDAVIRQVSNEEADAAFGGGEGGPVGTLEDRHAGKALPVTGIRLVSPGGKDVKTEPDARAAANIAARKARAAGPQKPAPKPAETEDWEIEAPAATPAPERPREAPAPVSALETQVGGDLLERSRRAALRMLSALPPGFELFVGSGLTPSGVELVMGLGFLLGKAQAAYRGDGHYCITDTGREQARSEGL